MNDEEVRALLATHYDNEAQTLTSGTEANLLKLRELLGWLRSPKPPAGQTSKPPSPATCAPAAAGS